MMIKVVPAEHTAPGEYYHDMILEADRVEIQFHKEIANDEMDWFYVDTDRVEDGVSVVANGYRGPAFAIRTWKITQPLGHQSYEIGLVRGGRIFVTNEAGKTVDKYVI